MRRPDSVAEIVYGPLVSGYSLTISSKGLGWPFFGPSLSSAHLRENSGRKVPTLNSVSLLRSFRSKRIVRSSITTAAPTLLKACCQVGDDFALLRQSKLYLTSSASTGSPLLK